MYGLRLAAAGAAALLACGQVLANEPTEVLGAWWAMQDEYAASRADHCRKAWESSSISSRANEVASGELKAFLSDSPCSGVTPYRREVSTVTMETPARAVVVAQVWNDEDWTSAGLPSAEIERVQAGQSYRYVMTKSDGRWAITQVYERDEFSGSAFPWRPLYSARIALFRVWGRDQ